MFDTFWHKTLRRPYRLYVRHSGDFTKPAVVLLHGIAASSEDWRKVLPHLEGDYHCITLDLLGFGKSPKPQWSRYTMDDHMRSIYHTMNKLGIDGQFILIGHSLGSLLATRYVKEHEANVSRLVLLSPPVYPPLDSIQTKAARRLTGILLNIYRFLRNERIVKPETFRRLSYIAPLPKSIVRDPRTWIPFMRTLKECIEQQTVLDDASTLHLPIDICYGTLDQVLVSANVQLLGGRPNVRLHQFLGTHDLTGRYGELVSEVLSREPSKG